MRPLTDQNTESMKIEFPDLECVREGKPYFRARRKDFTKVYECDEYKCDAHPRGCLFCKHSTDICWDFTNGPYMVICELQKENDQDMPTSGCIGECEYFEDKEL